jgi:hypothetical protein
VGAEPRGRRVQPQGSIHAQCAPPARHLRLLAAQARRSPPEVETQSAFAARTKARPVWDTPRAHHKHSYILGPAIQGPVGPHGPPPMLVAVRIVACSSGPLVNAHAAERGHWSFKQQLGPPPPPRPRGEGSRQSPAAPAHTGKEERAKRVRAVCCLPGAQVSIASVIQPCPLAVQTVYL